MQSEIHREINQLESQYPLRLLGHTTDDTEEYISEEQRFVNTHIIGAPGQGKSKFLVYNIIEDIKLGNGLCLLDPTSNGSTAKEVLSYCASNGYEKVCYIDHATIYKYDKVPAIRPLWGREVDGVIYPDKASVGGVMEAVQILFNIKKITDTSRMKPRLEALFRTLIRQKATLYEARYFSRYNDFRRYEFLGEDDDSDTLAANFRTQATFENYFSSSVNSIDIFSQEPLSLMFAADTGIDFQKMVRDKWVILVNLCPAGNFNLLDSQVLGVLIISQILQAVDALDRGGWKGREYIYIDEAGRFATPQLNEILSHKRHLGVSLIIAHQYMKQFEFENVLESILENTGVKVMFNVRDPADRLRMMKSFNYGGDITPEAAAWANADLKKQYAIIKNDKGNPKQIRTPDVVVPNIDPTSYIEWLLTDKWYLSRGEIKSQINARLLHKDSKSSKPRKTSNRPPVGSAPLSKRQGSDKIPKGSKEPPIPPQGGPIKI